MLPFIQRDKARTVLVGWYWPCIQDFLAFSVECVAMNMLFHVNYILVIFVSIVQPYVCSIGTQGILSYTNSSLLCAVTVQAVC